MMKNEDFELIYNFLIKNNNKPKIHITEFEAVLNLEKNSIVEILQLILKNSTSLAKYDYSTGWWFWENYKEPSMKRRNLFLSGLNGLLAISVLIISTISQIYILLFFLFPIPFALALYFYLKNHGGEFKPRTIEEKMKVNKESLLVSVIGGQGGLT